METQKIESKQTETTQNVVEQNNFKIGFKVVKKISKKTYKPCTLLALQRIRYRIANPTIQNKEEHGAFAVFQNLESAQSFLYNIYDTKNTKNMRILKVQYLPSDEKKLWKKEKPSIQKSKYGGYFFVSNGIKEKYIEDCPYGTELAQVVIPIEEVN
ncbi:MAG: hypothetical protein NWE98_02205 [Candidatus Bathyarchaeota archaeon]|nr:hypothetical protein [Candidatus Bathyarchaeota archaeon]